VQVTISQPESDMTYTKPEIAVLGKAVRVIEQLVKGRYTITEFVDPRAPKMNPAYDLDE
jgi:hypothetical protein